MTRARSDDGSTSLEFILMVPYLFLAAAFAWQLLLMGAATTAAENAARNGSRAETGGQSGSDVAVDTLPSWLRNDAAVSTDGTLVSVTVEVPLLFPGLGMPGMTLRREAELPPSA